MPIICAILLIFLIMLPLTSILCMLGSIAEENAERSKLKNP